VREQFFFSTMGCSAKAGQPQPGIAEGSWDDDESGRKLQMPTGHRGKGRTCSAILGCLHSSFWQLTRRLFPTNSRFNSLCICKHWDEGHRAHQRAFVRGSCGHILGKTTQEFYSRSISSDHLAYVLAVKKTRRRLLPGAACDPPKQDRQF
jgi:hypothetical protein